MNQSPKHIILGFGGAIGRVLAEELVANHERVKLVSRSGHSIAGAESAKADLANLQEVKEVMEDSSIVYLLAGLPYDISIWRALWPKIMQNAIEACKAKNARLIFFDNVYAYGRVNGPMTEETPLNPSSKKGEVRVRLADKLMSEVKSGNIVASIARAADFYGPYSEKTSVPFILIIDKLAKGKKAQWLVNVEAKHSFTYTGDCGKALFLLAKADNAYNQVWHLPTASPPLTGKEFIHLVAREMGRKAEYAVVRKWTIALAAIFNKTMREIYEMLYQNEYDYIFDSSKFEKRFDFKPKSYEAGIEEMITHFRGKGIIA